MLHTEFLVDLKAKSNLLKVGLISNFQPKMVFYSLNLEYLRIEFSKKEMQSLIGI